MRKKHLGKCSHCREEFTPKIIEENSIRRDICQCPNCGEKILVCRTLGCNNYAKFGAIYDEEFCFECSEKIAKTFKESGEILFKPALMSLSAVIGSKVNNFFKK